MPGPAASPEPRQLGATRAAWCVLGLALAAAVLWAASPDLDAPWILGDEHLFIVNNPDVTGAGRLEAVWQRWLGIFTHRHEDLYQPFTILTYAIQWRLWGEDCVFYVRLTDVLIHAVNALLLWALLRALLLRLTELTPAPATTLAWALAALWALHPMLVGAYAADMGRTHLLSATFTFLAGLCHLRALNRGRRGWFGLACVALLLAMLNKPVVGWVVVVLALEWALLGLRATLRSPRVYVVGAICALFAVLTLWTTRESLLLEDSPLPLFGDPVARAALGLCLYLRNFVLPLGWLSAWYPPDAHTGWGHPLVWVGVLVASVAAGLVVWSMRRRRMWGIAVGLAWAAAMWLPVSGLIGARVAAAQDRYMYLPATGLLLSIGVGLAVAVERAGRRARWCGPAVATGAVVLGLAALPWDRSLCRLARSTLRRAQHAVRLDPNDPRVTEYLAMAYNFARNHPTPEDRLPDPPNPSAEFERALRRAAGLAEQNPRYFRDAHDRAAFHRRLSFQWWALGQQFERLHALGPDAEGEPAMLLEQLRAAGIAYEALPQEARGRYELSLEQARRAHDFEPEARLTWLRLAHGYRALRRWDEARRAYEKLMQVSRPDAPEHGLRLTEFADLLLHHFDDPRGALELYRAALLSPEITPQAQRVAWLGAARCEVLAGSGRDGFELAREVLINEPENLEALRIVALYHLRSHHWAEAEAAYRLILERVPDDYEALRGFYSVCAENATWQAAADAWRGASRREPENLTYRAWSVWAAACAADEKAAELAQGLLADVPDNRFGCLAKMLLALRAGALPEALDWIERAAGGTAVPIGRELVRAEAAVRLMLERGELPPAATPARAALLTRLGDRESAGQVLEQYLAGAADQPERALAERLLADLRGHSAEP